MAVKNKLKDPVVNSSKKRRPTIYEESQMQLENMLGTIVHDIKLLYMNMENLLTYTTIISNINTVLVEILIKKKITTEAGVKREYERIVKEMKIKEKEMNEQMQKYQSLSTQELDFSDIDYNNMKVS